MNQKSIYKQDNFDEIEDELRVQRKSKSKKHKVSGKSVFKLEKIIKDRSHDKKS